MPAKGDVAYPGSHLWQSGGIVNENFIVLRVGQTSSSGRVRCEGAKEYIGRILAKICQTTAGLELNSTEFGNATRRKQRLDPQGSSFSSSLGESLATVATCGRAFRVSALLQLALGCSIHSSRRSKPQALLHFRGSDLRFDGNAIVA
jgi:hypothetical protein